MKASFTFTGTPKHYIASQMPDLPILFFNPIALRNRLKVFQKGFPGLVTYAIKANDAPEVLENLSMAGLQTFDVASPAEIMQSVGYALMQHFIITTQCVRYVRYS